MVDLNKYQARVRWETACTPPPGIKLDIMHN